MKNATYVTTVLTFLNVILVHELKPMDEQSKQDEAVIKLEHLLSQCAIERSIQAPPNTPSPLSSAYGSDVGLERCQQSFNCLVSNCLSSYVSFKLLQEHMFNGHALFLCLCGGCFHEYLSYDKHCQSCSYYT